MPGSVKPNRELRNGSTRICPTEFLLKYKSMSMKEESFEHIVLEPLDFHKHTYIYTYIPVLDCTPHTKIDSKRIMDLNVKHDYTDLEKMLEIIFRSLV